MITEDIRVLSTLERYEFEDTTPQEIDKDALFPETVIHHLSKTSYIWNFSLIYREGFFDIIKWKSAFAYRWKENKLEGTIEIVMEKGLFIGAIAGIFFISVDEDIYENFNNLADMMDVFLEKTHGEAPFLVYGVIESKGKIAELKTNKDMMKNLGDVKKWVAQHGGEFRLENLAEIKMNLSYLINEYSYYILTHLKGITRYTDLRLGEVHFLDYDDLSALKEIEAALSEQVKVGETVDQLLSKLFFELLKKPEFQEEVYAPPSEATTAVEAVRPSKIKLILEEIRLGIRRQCPNCFNKDRNKIREVIDREHILMENPNIYGWKLICGLCGHEWKTKQFEWKSEDDSESN